MRTSASFLPILLSGLGLIPFLFAMYISWIDSAFLGKSGHEIFTTYSATILSFLGGTLWGQFIHKTLNPLTKYLLISSNLITLGAWLSLLLEMPTLSIALLLLGFISTFWVEARFLKSIIAPDSRYLNMRFALTIAVSVLHLFMLYPHY